MSKESLISLGDLALLLGVRKSQLQYYAGLGILPHELSAGRMKLFYKEKALKTIKKIEELRKSGKKINEIKKLL